MGTSRTVCNHKLFINFGIVLLLVVSACDNSSEVPEIQSDLERRLITGWQFSRLEVNSQWVQHVAWGFEPNASCCGWVPWFWFNYKTDGSYEFNSTGRKIPLGYSKNFQPELGFWTLDEEQRILIHNRGMPYETVYRILELSDTLFIREYDRIIYDSSDTTIWPVGSTAVYKETFGIRK